MANDAAPALDTSLLAQFRADRLAAKTKSEVLAAALAGINKAAMKKAITAAADAVWSDTSPVWSPEQLHGQLQASRDAWLDRFDSRVQPYVDELRKRMVLASVEPLAALVVALDGIQSAETRRDLCAAAALLMMEAGGDHRPAKPLAAPVPPSFSKQGTSWVKEIGKSVTLVRIVTAPDDIALGFAAGRFRGAPAKRKAGWCLLDEPMCTDDAAYTRDRLTIGEFWCVGWRVDEAKLPARRLKLELQIRIREWCRKEGKEKCPKGVQAEIEELLTAEALRERLPETRIFPVIIDLAGGNVLLHGVRDADADEILKALRFAGFVLDVHGAEDVVAVELAATLCRTVADDIRLDEAPRAREEDGEVFERHVHREFLLWLWWRASTSNGTGLLNSQEPTQVEWWIETPIVLSSPAGPDDKPHTVTIAGSEPENTGAALAALAEGFTPTAMRIGVRVPSRVGEIQDGDGNSSTPETREFHATLEGWGERSVWLPSIIAVEEAGDIPGAVFERLELYREFSAARDRLFVHFARRRADPNLWALIRRDIREWVGLELARKFITDDTGKQGLLFGACQRLIPVRAD